MVSDIFCDKHLNPAREYKSHLQELYPMVNLKLIFEFRDSEKSEFDLAQFAGYIAIRSIKGKKPYCKTNK